MHVQGSTVTSDPRQPEMDAGRHHRARLGFILMSTDPSAEADFADMTPPGVAVHITRLKTDDYTTTETLARHIDHMAEADEIFTTGNAMKVMHVTQLEDRNLQYGRMSKRARELYWDYAASG